jgi:arginyl-tRNA synthetase
MYSLDKIKLHIVKKINQALEQDIVNAADFSYPPNPEMGDLSLACFQIAKNLKSNPTEVIAKIINKIKSDKMIAGMKAAGPYLNITLNKEYLIEEVIKEIEKEGEKYGENKIGKKQKVMIEYTNANTHKEYHVGHLRNVCYGDSVYRILKVNGYKAIPVSYINDFGIHVAKTLWNYNAFIKNNYSGDISSVAEDERGYILGKMYVDAATKEKEDNTAKQMIGGIMKMIESRQGEEYKLWQETRQWSIKHFDKIYNDLGVKLEKIFYENEFIDKGKQMIDELIAKGVLEKSQGAVIANLEKYNLGVLIFLRSDGTATYPVADLPLAMEKINKYKLDKSIYVVDVRQKLYFQQLFKVLELLGFKADLVHLGYEFVKLPSGMMSSRTGNVITYNELYQEVISRAKKEIQSRHDDWSADKIEKVAKIIGVGAIKFEMIKVSSQNVIVFDIEKALSFEGYTAAYVQYSYARICSIFKKSKNKNQK